MKKSKALIHIGGSYLQLPGIRWAKELDLHVIVTDKNPDAIGRMLADQFEVISGTEVPALLKLAYRINHEHELVGAYASNDFGLPAVAEIAEAMGRPGCSRLAVERALDKSVSKDIWRRENLSTPKAVSVTDRKTLFSALDEFSLPVIIKPTKSSGSQGVQSVWNAEDLQQAFITAQQFSNSVLVEQLISGHHIDVNGLFAEGRFIPCGTMDRFFSELPYHYPVWGCQPSSLNREQEHTVYMLVEKAARVLGIDVGPIKADVVWTVDEPVILELAPRFHGDVSTAYVTFLVTGGSPIKTWMAYLKGTEDWLNYLQKKTMQFAGWMALFSHSNGKLFSVKGVDTARKKRGIKDIFISKKPGTTIIRPEDNRAVCGFIWATGIDRDTLFENLKSAQSDIRFVTH